VKEKVLARISPSTQSGVRPPRREHSGQLQGDSATTSHVIAQGIIANGPLLCMGAVMTSAAIYAQGSLPLAYLLGAVVVWLWVNTPLQYSKRLASAG
jgi:hypothetical protein